MYSTMMKKMFFVGACASHGVGAFQMNQLFMEAAENYYRDSPQQKSLQEYSDEAIRAAYKRRRLHNIRSDKKPVDSTTKNEECMRSSKKQMSSQAKTTQRQHQQGYRRGRAQRREETNFFWTNVIFLMKVIPLVCLIGGLIYSGAGLSIGLPNYGVYFVMDIVILILWILLCFPGFFSELKNDVKAIMSGAVCGGPPDLLEFWLK